jgi:chromatin remodeling complex protein RSC6
MAYEYVKEHYGVNPEPGMRVKMDEKLGTVVAKKAYDHYVHVRFDDRKFDVPVHPMDLVYGVDS